MWKSVVLIFKVSFSFIWFSIGNFLIRFWPGITRPVVEVRQGKVRGITSTLPGDVKYHYFKGIPYGKPPVGKLRFQSPVPLERFSQPVLDCSYDRPDLIQPDVVINRIVFGSEDGLYLNVFTPGLPNENDTKYPVMVFIHGGGYRYGSPTSFLYEPKSLVRRGVVVVSMSYRLGPLGFLSLPSAGISGNMGLKDQRLALQWVHENIGQFNGDAENVTLFGQSAGSWSTYLHYLSPKSRKYFQRVICLSGDSCSEAAFQVDPEGKARKLAQLLGYRGNTDQEVLETLMKASAKSLVRLQSRVQNPLEDGDPLRVFLFKPVIEHESVEDSFITQMPEQILKCYDSLEMPIMSGNVSSEGLLALLLNRNNLDDYNKHVDWLVPRFMGYSAKLDRKAVGEQIKRFFVGDSKIGWNTADETSDLMTDSTFVGSSNLSAEWIAKYQPNVTHYKYFFTFEGRLNLFKILFNMSEVHGVDHGDDVFYLFSPNFLPKLAKDSVENKMREIYITLLTNFAKFNDPTPDESNLGFKWNPVAPVRRDSDSFDFDCLEVNVPSRMVRNPNEERNDFWRNLLKVNTELL
ncbi:venom carboxylesterase-6 [Culex quinquefasciatus]|uniref:venom carboxylesterase-6 n=1 Tax=Culex quinquefasciatus TaxID=7176 RepID=UPI0018E3C53D|nr:venom carboxylesterase-6 [Culex quinquefasciatus]